MNPPGPQFSPLRQLSEHLLELACCADELADRGPTALHLPGLPLATQRQAARLWRRCDALVAETVAFQIALAPYLDEPALDEAA